MEGIYPVYCSSLFTEPGLERGICVFTKHLTTRQIPVDKSEQMYYYNETMDETIIKKRGAKPGNQYARKHGFYSKVLDEEERRDFELAVTVQGLDQEIALLRVKIKSLIQRDPENLRLIMQAVNSLMKLVMARYDISKEDKQGLKEAILNVLRDIALPLGIGIGTNLNR